MGSTTRARHPAPIPPTRPPRGLVLVEPKSPSIIDWSSWELDPEVDQMQTPEHHETATCFESALKVLAEREQWVGATICQDTAFAWVREQPKVCVSPDVYLVIDGPIPPPSSYQMWVPGHRPPAFALEVVSSDRIKEYDVNPEKYASLGAEELVIFDPGSLGKRRAQGRAKPLIRYSRDADGVFTLREAVDGRLYSHVLNAWLIFDPESPGRLRLSSDGNTYVPTHEELAAAERLARVAAETEVAILRAELERLRAAGR